MSFRKEEKCVLSKFELEQIKVQLAAQGMKPLHPRRFITSTYFDNSRFSSFHDSEEGSHPRKKIRIRNYIRGAKDGQLEIKISSIEGRFKVSERLSADRCAALKRFGYVDRLYGRCFPVVVVEYEREYFTLKGVRITMDQNIRYYTYGRNHSRKEPMCVLELKTGMGVGADYLTSVIDIPRRRFSKFCNGINSVCLGQQWVA